MVRLVRRVAVLAASIALLAAVPSARGLPDPLATSDAVVLLGAVPAPADVQAVSATGALVRPFTQLPMLAVRATAAQLALVGAVPGVRSVTPDRTLQLVLHESAPAVGADVVHAAPFGLTGAGVGVAVIDSGIDGGHPDVHFPDHTKQNVKLLGATEFFTEPVITVENVPDTDTTNGHGTHVAGIVAGTGAASTPAGFYTGIAPGADLVGLGAGDGPRLLTTLAAYDWVLAHRNDYHLRVINNSWADGTIAYDPNDPLNVASRRAHDNGITVVFAAGNDGPNPGTLNRYAWPDWVLSVGGTDVHRGLWSGSSRGDGVHDPTLVAPGYFIASARSVTGGISNANGSPADPTDLDRIVSVDNLPYYNMLIGTSMAAPHVAGAVALLLQANPGLTPDQVKSLLASTADPIAGCARPDCGAGFLDIPGAARAALRMRNRPPTAALAVIPPTGVAPLPVTLDATGSRSPDLVGLVRYAWDLDGNGKADRTTAGPTTTWTYQKPGTFRPTVRVTDDRGLISPAATATVVATKKKGK